MKKWGQEMEMGKWGQMGSTNANGVKSFVDNLLRHKTVGTFSGVVSGAASLPLTVPTNSTTSATAGLFSCFDVQVVARAFECAGADEDALVDEVLKVARGGGARGARDRNIILGAQAALKTLHPFAEDPGESFFLPLIEPTLDPVVELGFLDQEVDHALCRVLRLQNSVCGILPLGQTPVNPLADASTP